MSITVPDWVRAENNVCAYFLPGMASQAAGTVAEFTAGIDLTPFFPADWEGITSDQAKGSQTRMALAESFEILGRITRSIADMEYTYLPQGLGTLAGNKAYTMLATGTAGFLVIRYGIPTITAIASTQKYDSVKVITGVQNKKTSGSDEFAPLTVTQSFSAQAAIVSGVVA